MRNQEVMYLLQTIKGIGNVTIARLWNYFITGKDIIEAKEQELRQLMKPSQVDAFLHAKEYRNPEAEIIKLKKMGINYYSIFHEQYPTRLKKIADNPYGLFVKGKLPEEDSMAVAIVGTRKHSYYGEKYTKVFSRLISQKGVPIISGMAKGIDGIAQKTALEYGGDTYAVLGCGVDICYPWEHKMLYEQIPLTGGIISEYPPGTQPAAGLFPMRNRIISGLSDILLVMEAREKSGTLITADIALEQGKEIWVLPGRVDDVLSAGCNRLLGQGAGLLPTVEEFEEELDLLLNKYSKKKLVENKNLNTTPIDTAVLSQSEQNIMEVLDYHPHSVNHIYDKLISKNGNTYTIQQISVLLMELCMKQLARQVEGGYYIRY